MNDSGNGLDECVHYSRLIGADPALVLHGGGNSSVKTSWRDITGRDVDAMFVKGSGWEMGSIDAAGFAPLSLTRLRELLELESLSDGEMMRELEAAKLDPAAPTPSVETLLHAFLPFAAVLHSHADVIVTLTNLANGAEIVSDVFGDAVVAVPYVMPGFDLAREVRRVWPEQAHGGTRGMVLLNHGLFTFGATSREAYERHLELLETAEDWLNERAPAADGEPPPPTLPEVALTELAELRREVSQAASRPLVLQRHTDPVVRRFVARPDLASLAARGPLTPDHVIRTKPTPLVGRDVAAFADSYSAYFAKHAPHARTEPTMLDPAPRVILDAELGMITAGSSARDAQVVADIYHHTIPVLERAEDHLGGYVPLPPERLFEVEYWELEQAKLRRAGEPPALAGTVALVTGAASGIGRACAEALLARGVAVAGLDLSPDVETRFESPAWKGVVADVTDAGAVDAALRQDRRGVRRRRHRGHRSGRLRAERADRGARRGGVALGPVGQRRLGRAPSPRPPPIPRTLSGRWTGRRHRVEERRGARAKRGRLFRVEGGTHAAEPRRRARMGGRRDPPQRRPPGRRLRHGALDPELLAERAGRYGVDVETYKRRNLLRTEITSEDVARAVVALCDDTFRVTTGAQIPIDGGNERVV